MIKATRWRPDSCRCSLIYEWDTEEKADNKTLKIKSVEKCPAHKELTDEQAFDTVKVENKMINAAYKILVAETSAKWEEIFYKWGVDKRVVEITHPSLTAQSKITLQAVIDHAVGEGKVKVL